MGALSKNLLKVVATVAGSLLLLAGAVSADSWIPATRTAYLSSDKTVRLTVIPRELAGALPYFEDKVKGKEPAGQLPGSQQKQARGVLEKKSRDGRWSEVWAQPLVNEVAPTHALVADSAKYVVTFDNWHSAGYGSDVVVIYDARGAVIRAFALKDFLPEAYVEALPRSVSSIWWGGEHRLVDNDNTLELQVVEPSKDMDDSKRRYVDIRIRLADGTVIPPTGQAWHRARGAAAEVKAANDAEQRAWAAHRAAPLLAPKTEDEGAWRDYMVEVFVRVTPDSHALPAIYFLPAENAPNFAAEYADVTEWVAEKMTDERSEGDVLMFASPTPARFADLLAAIAGRIAPGSLKGVRVYFVGDANSGQRAKAALEKSGAEVSLIDTAKSLPPQKEPNRNH